MEAQTRKIWIVTLYPEYFEPLLNCGVVGSALTGKRGEGKFELQTIQLRDFSETRYASVDDYPFGGGPGMIMRPDILARALEEGIFAQHPDRSREDYQIIYPCPRGPVWNNQWARSQAITWWGESPKDLVFICGRYEGIDERFIERYIDSMFSLGDYIISGGELAVMAILDSALRFAPGVLGNKQSSCEESFEDGLLEGPQYTRPREFAGLPVPEILLSGNHKKIDEYKTTSRLEMTRKYRPDLLKK